MKYLMKIFFIKTSTNLFMWWNFGSLISIFMIIQILTGLMLSMNYLNKNNEFFSSFNIFFNLNYGWLLRIIHNNTTSMIFILILIHLKRNMYFKLYFNKMMWWSGLLMMLFLMMESFLGYSLIWNQMSYWAMMVITNFISSIPMIGNLLISWIWGNFNINIILINRFFSFHFLMPMIILILIFIHLMILHLNKSSNPLGMNNKLDLIMIYPLSIYKDLNIFLLFMFLMFNLMLINPFFLNNNDNFIIMNYFKTPEHIEPEWYFLFFYSILRSINNKLNGLLILILSIMILFFIPMMKNKFQNFNFMNKIMFLILFYIIIMISMLSKKNMEYPYMIINKIMIINYFLIFMMNFYIK